MLSGLLLTQLTWAGGVLPAAGAETPTQLEYLSFSWSGGLLRGTQVKYVDVSLHLVDPDGIAVSGDVPAVWLTNTSDQVLASVSDVPYRTVRPHLVAGTEFDGTWRGRFAVGANDAGIWKAHLLWAGDFVTPDHGFGPQPAPIPAPWNTVTMNVRGYDPPAAWLGTPVRSAGGYVIRGGVRLRLSQAPVVGMRVELLWLLEEQVGCAYRIAARTDASGRFAYQVPSLVDTNGTGVAVWRVYPTDSCTSILMRSNVRTWI